MIRSLLLATFSVLAAVGTADGECTWVLWVEQSPDSGEWRLFPLDSVFDSRKDCELIARDSQDATNRKAQSAEERGLPSEVFRKLYRCFPDTVDPRGPKGGGR